MGNPRKTGSQFGRFLFSACSQTVSAKIAARIPFIAMLLFGFLPPCALAQIAISSITELQKIGSDPAYPANGHYILTQDIDASETATWNNGKGFAPIGTDVHNGFSGIFDGQNHKVINLTINLPDSERAGLFGLVLPLGKIINLGLDGGSVSGRFSVGGLAGEHHGEITSCFSSCAIHGSNCVGGLVGLSAGNILDSHASGKVTGKNEVGGLAGALHMLKNITESYATGQVIGRASIGGLVGEIYAGRVANSFATGSVYGRIGAGGLVGRLGDSEYDSSITDCYATGAVSGESMAGGLVGRMYGRVSRAFATGPVCATRDIGGLVGALIQGELSESYASGPVYGNENTGGLIGRREASCVVSKSFWCLESSGRQDSAGGLGLEMIEFLNSSTFKRAGWNYDEYWVQRDGFTVPYFSWAAVNDESSISVMTRGSGALQPPGGSFASWTLVTITAIPDALSLIHI